MSEMTSTTKRAYVINARASTTNTNFLVFAGACWIQGGLITQLHQHYCNRMAPSAKSSYRPKRIGILASIAPTILQIYIESHTGNGWLVTCAMIIRPTTCANSKPQAQRNGTNAGEFIMSEFRKDGWFSHAACTKTVTGNGRRYSNGLITETPDARRALNTLM
jgi:hypothetical protein